MDILAFSGALGFGSPKICVQVKSTDAPADRMVLDQLGGVMKNFGAEYGLLASWSGFKFSVINETAKQFFDIRLWTHQEIIQEFLKHYGPDGRRNESVYFIEDDMGSGYKATVNFFIIINILGE